MKQRKRGKQKENKEKSKKNLECKRGGTRTRSGITRLTNQRTQRHPIKTRGGKQGSFFRPADKETKERIQFELVSTPKEEHKRSLRNIKVPSKFAFAAEYESSSEYKESSDEEDWECKECRGDEGRSGEYTGCDKCSRWYHKRCSTFESKESHFECHKCLAGP